MLRRQRAELAGIGGNAAIGAYALGVACGEHAPRLKPYVDDAHAAPTCPGSSAPTIKAMAAVARAAATLPAVRYPAVTRLPTRASATIIPTIAAGMVCSFS